MEEQTNDPDQVTSIIDPLLLDGGTITVADTVITAVAFREVVDMPGVVQVEGLGSKEIEDVLHRGDCPRSWSKVIRIEEGRVDLDLHLMVSYGTSIPDLAEQIKERLGAKVEEFTGFKVGALKVLVDGVIDEG
ncbi:MAG: Asp23/Gls24 family envelope stress response protein [Planctomycetota bacterium]|jgi:uncharacterized alkaline shock family protein YloU|nr:Asp23/Gls24 family envelope stress response protein [Planctomycetota bacterium]MDP7254899.1 Asp23/Gls24 family envelope stress response protein [Planctomycetota bacterium]